MLQMREDDESESGPSGDAREGPDTGQSVRHSSSTACFCVMFADMSLSAARCPRVYWRVRGSGFFLEVCTCAA